MKTMPLGHDSSGKEVGQVMRDQCLNLYDLIWNPEEGKKKVLGLRLESESTRERKKILRKIIFSCLA